MKLSGRFFMADCASSSNFIGDAGVGFSTACIKFDAAMTSVYAEEVWACQNGEVISQLCLKFFHI